MKKIAYIVAYITLGFFAGQNFDKYSKETGGFYVYIDTKNGKVDSVNEYRPEIEWRSADQGILLPFVKGTDRVIVALDTTSEGEQWLWNTHSDSVSIIPEGYGFVTLDDNQIPKEIRESLAIYDQGNNGKIYVKAIAPEHRITRTPPISLR